MGFVGSPTFFDLFEWDFVYNFGSFASQFNGIADNNANQNEYGMTPSYSTVSIGSTNYTRYNVYNGYNQRVKESGIYIYKTGNITNYNQQVNIKINAPNSTIKSPSFAFAGVIKIGSGFFAVYREQVQTHTWYSLYSKYNPSVTSFKPYQPLGSLSGIGLRYYKNEQDFSSYDLGTFHESYYDLNSLADIKNAATSHNLPASGYYTNANTQYSFTAVIFGLTVTWYLTTTDWDNKAYSIVQTSTQYNIYSGKVVENDFLSAFKVVYTVSNIYKSISTDYSTSLDINKMSNTIIKESDSAFFFHYEVVPQNIINVTVTSNIKKLASGNGKFANVTYKKSYNLGETIVTFNPNVKGSLTYEDDTTIALSSISYAETPTVTTSLGNFPITINPAHGLNFTMTYTYPTTHFGTLTVTFNCEVAESQDIASMVLVNAKKHFIYGEAVDFGSTALGTKIECFNVYGNKISEIPYADFNAHITSKDNRYGKTINGTDITLTTSELTLESVFDDVFAISYKIKMSYAAGLVVNSDAINKYVYIDNNFTQFADLNLATASVTYYNNSGATLVIETKNVTSVLSLTHGSLNFALNTQVMTIAASAGYEGRTLTLANAFQITCELIRPTQIVVSGTGGTTVYFDNNEDTFKVPADLSFSLIFNNSTEESPNTAVVNPLTELTFYRDSNLTQVLDNDSIIRSNGGNRIYFKYKEYDLSGSYVISFIEDEIDVVEINTPLNFTLGNRFNTLRNLFDIKITYISGRSVTNYTNFTFKQNTVILSATAPIIIVAGNEYTLDINDITFIKPSISAIDIDSSNLNTSYSNDTDTLDVVSNITVITKYQDAEFVEQCTYDQAGLTTNGKYIIESSELPVGFGFDGSDVINIDMDGEVEKEIELEITVLNYFNNLNTTNNQTSILINVLEITDITGISLAKLMNNYNVGDSFLDPTIDDTEVFIYYNQKVTIDNEERTIQKKKRIKLASGFGAINIFPIKGTKFIRTNEALTIRITAATNERASLEYTISVSSRSVAATDIQKHTLRAVQIPVYVHEEYIFANKYLIVEDMYTSVLNGVRKLNDGVSINEIKVYGYLDNINDKTSNGRVVFFEDYVPPVVGESNIKVTFPCFVEGQADRINKCTIGQLFGNNNSKNRLFLSGNPDLPNCDWHSGAINTSKIEGDFSDENGDFTYFDDLSYCFYGQTDNKIVGYDIVANDKMVVLKSKSDKEPTIYYRTSGLIQALDASGNAVTDFSGRTLYEESYPLVVGNISVGALSNKAMLNFNGDTVFLSSDKQLDGLDVQGVIGDTQRYANSRSYFINPLLKTLDLKNAWLYTNQKYLYLITKDFILISHFEAFNSEERQYEWWKINIAGVSAFIEIGEELYFGTTEGKFTKLESIGFQDITKIFLDEGEAVPLVAGQEFDDQIQVSNITVNKLTNGDDYYFTIVSKESDFNSYMYNQIATINNVKNGTFDLYIDKDLNALEIVGLVDSVVDKDAYERLIRQLSTERIYYLNRREEENEIVDTNPTSPLKVYGKTYKLKLVEEFYMNKGLLFKLVDTETGAELSLQTLSRAALVERMTETYKIVDIDYTNARFKLRDNRDEVLNIVRYSAQSMTKNFKAEISKYRNVRAYYITAPHTMGDLMHNKTIWGWTLTNDTLIKSAIEVCQATNETHLEQMTTIVDFNRRDYGLNLENFNVANIDFTKYTIPHKYTFYRPLNVPFISFGFRNNDSSNAVLSSMQIIYTIAFASFGNQ